MDITEALSEKGVWRDNCERIDTRHTRPAQLQNTLQDAVSWKQLSLLVVFWKPALLLKIPWLFICLFALTKYFTFLFAEAIVSSGKTEKSPHDQEIKFFAKVTVSPLLKISTTGGVV